MIKPALSDEILLKIEKPARYIGNEINSVVKDPSGKLRFAFCFPDVYEIGMSHLGIQILYDMFNRRDDVWCERVYSPWPDLAAILKEQQIPLFCLESQEPVRNADFLGFTLQYEMCYTNILQVLDLSQIPLLANDRRENDPIVIGGGPCACNPEPIAAFFDCFYIGEGETRYDELFDLYLKMKGEGKSRAEFLHEAAKIEGIYVPSLYEPRYHADGTIAEFVPLAPDIPAKIRRQAVEELTKAVYPNKPVVSYLKATQDRVVLEIQRGCIRGCRFCQAGMIYRPNREKDAARLKELAHELLQSTGHEEISLSSLSSSDYGELGELLDALIAECSEKHINISLPSLRIDAFSLDIMKKVQDVKKSSLTFAPEAGSQRLRDVINKGLTSEEILSGAGQAFAGGWNKVKLYFMLGLPTETEDDMRAIPELANEIAALYYDTVPKELRNGKCQITISTSFFVPKPFTPFQWAVMQDRDEYLRRAKIVNDHRKAQLNHKSISYNWHEADVTVLEGVLARGDRRLSDVILHVYEHGGVFDAWSDYFDYQRWLDAFAACHVDIDFYNRRVRAEDEIFPWDFIDAGVSREFLLREWKAAMEGKVTPNCGKQCSACGAAKYQSGVCVARGKAEKETGADKAQNDAAKIVQTAEKNRANAQSEEPQHIKLRLKFRKWGVMRYVGHLDMMRYFQKAMRRADIDICYSQGFSPHQIMSFAAPLGVGLTSDGEYLDIEVYSAPSGAEIVRRLNAVMADGVEITSCVRLADNAKNAMSMVAAADYRVYFKEGTKPPCTAEELRGLIRREFAEKPQFLITKQTKKGEREVDLKPLVYRMNVEETADGPAVLLTVSTGSTDNLKPELLLMSVLAAAGAACRKEDLQVHRLEVYAREDGRLVPLSAPGEAL